MKKQPQNKVMAQASSKPKVNSSESRINQRIENDPKYNKGLSDLYSNDAKKNKERATKYDSTANSLNKKANAVTTKAKADSTYARKESALPVGFGDYNPKKEAEIRKQKNVSGTFKKADSLRTEAGYAKSSSDFYKKTARKSDSTANSIKSRLKK
jgi:hypothetical protein